MSDSVSDLTSFCFPGDQKDMGSITDKNQGFSTEGITKGVEDDIPDDDCILSEKEFNMETTSNLEEVCDDTVNDSTFKTNNTVLDMKEKSSSKCDMALEDPQSGDHVSDISAESVLTTKSLKDKDLDKKDITEEHTKLHYDKYRKSFPNKQDELLETGFDNTVTKCQMKEESCQYPNKASGEKNSQVGTDVLKAQSENISCSMQTEERADCSHNNSGRNSENHIYKKSVIIETIMNILNRNQKQLENNMSVAGNLTDNGKSQTVDNKRNNKGYFHSFSSLLSAASTETPSNNSEGRKLQRSSVTTQKIVFDAVQMKNQLKSAFERVISQLEKLQQALYVLQFNSEDSVASSSSDSLKNQIKGMMTAVTQMYHIVYSIPQNNLSFLDALNQMATQLRKAEEEIIKSHDTNHDPVTYLLRFQETLDSLREVGVKTKDSHA